MLGEFEIPGDDSAKQGGKVGGQQNQSPAGSQSGSPQDAAAAQGGGGSQSGAPAQGGGAAGGAQAPGVQQGNPSAMAGGGLPIQNDPNAKAEGMQVAGLSGDPSEAGGGGQGGGTPGDVPKPQQVALGDPTMRIKPAANAPGVIGAATAGVTGGNTMQMESKMSSVGGGGSKDGKNSSEKGRVMPAGL